jgi:hypothetical protein
LAFARNDSPIDTQLPPPTGYHTSDKAKDCTGKDCTDVATQDCFDIDGVAVDCEDQASMDYDDNTPKDDACTEDCYPEGCEDKDCGDETLQDDNNNPYYGEEDCDDEALQNDDDNLYPEEEDCSDSTSGDCDDSMTEDCEDEALQNDDNLYPEDEDCSDSTSDCDSTTEDCEDDSQYEDCDPTSGNCTDSTIDDCDPTSGDCGETIIDDCDPTSGNCTDSTIDDCDPTTGNCNNTEIAPDSDNTNFLTEENQATDDGSKAVLIINQSADNIKQEIDSQLDPNEANTTKCSSTLKSTSNQIRVDMTVTLLDASNDQTLRKICNAWRNALTTRCGREFEDCMWMSRTKRQAGGVYAGTTLSHGPSSSGSSQIVVSGMLMFVMGMILQFF